jgi:class 3 adenylate cyclase
MRQALEGAASTFTLIRMDPRGFGLSDRDAPDISFEAMARDMNAVLKQVAVGSTIVLAMALAVHPAVIFAAIYPEHVSRLVLLGGTQGLRSSRNQRLDSLYELARVDWEFASETIERSFWDMDQDRVTDLARVLRESVAPETLFRLVNETEANFDNSAYLERLTMPTLILHDRSNKNVVSSDGARRVAATIPDARFVEIDSPWHTARAVARFLAETGAAPPRPARPPTDEATSGSGTAVIFFADIVDSTVLTERLGDTAFREKARDLDGALRAIIRDNGGTPIEGKLLGDGVLATFASASQAIAAALACGKAGEEGGLPLHLGLHAGDVIREENNVFGGAVNVAARISGLSAAGEVLVSDVVRSLARTSAGVSFEDRGERELKGVGEAVRVWAVVEGG